MRDASPDPCVTRTRQPDCPKPLVTVHTGPIERSVPLEMGYRGWDLSPRTRLAKNLSVDQSIMWSCQLSSASRVKGCYPPRHTERTERQEYAGEGNDVTEVN